MAEIATYRINGNNVTVIDFDCIVVECVVCGGPSIRSGIPMYEDVVLHNDYEGEWGGQPACEVCRHAQEGLSRPMRFSDFRRMLGQPTKGTP